MAEIDKTQRLQRMLEDIAGEGRVWFQPPESIKLKYPCIVFSRNVINDTKADNINYLMNVSYTVTVIDEDPDSKLLDLIRVIPSCRHMRNYKSNNLNHDVFTIYI